MKPFNMEAAFGRTEKSNDNHDEHGQFASAGGGAPAAHGWEGKTAGPSGTTFSHPAHSGHSLAINPQGNWTHASNNNNSVMVHGTGSAKDLAAHLNSFHGKK